MTFRGWLVMGLVAVLAGCASGGPSPVSADLTLSASEDVNPNSEGRPSPIMVRIFRLSSDVAFQDAGIVNLQGDEPTMLASDLTGPAVSNLLRPGQTLELDFSYAPETRHIGVVAEFIDPGAEWRRVVPVPEAGLMSKVRSPSLEVAVSTDAVTASFK